MDVSIKQFIKYLSFTVILAITACASKKSDRKVSFIKNLTAHYNIYYNASEMLKTTEINIKNSNKDDYNRLLKIFPIPSKETSNAETENLNEVILRANRIALEKYESNWIDDAFLLLAKAEYYKGNFFNAAEYFSYVSQNFPQEKQNTIEALIWHGKSLFALNKYKEADSVLQSAYAKNQKYYRAELNAALANSHLHQNKLNDAEHHLGKAVSFAKDRYSKIRWTYILAQLQEEVNKPETAYKNYGKVVKSNASFEMSFNANLSQVRLKESASGIQFNKIATLHRLLKEDKNKEFKDQIYYQIGQSYEDLANLKDAIKYYDISAHTEPGSAKQKALSYLKLAEINFDSLKNYSKAQLYYDSTLQSLPNDYPTFNAISLKAKNLQYLADRLMLIEEEKELLMLSKLPEDERAHYIENKIKENEKEDVVSSNQSANDFRLSSPDPNLRKDNETFYFNNSTAISQGINEFKKKWGNRKLSDNWRISSGVTNISIDQESNKSDATLQNTFSKKIIDKDSLKSIMLNRVPITADQKANTLNKIKNARYEIAMFYKEQLLDQEAAIGELEQSLEDYTIDEPKVAEIYYQLYRLYEDIDTQKSEQYKNLVIKSFPGSIYAKAILNPDFGKESETNLSNLRKEYETAYQSYINKNYTETIERINVLIAKSQEFPSEAAQFEYLKALAIGHTQKAPVFVAQLESILKKYPADSAVSSRIKNQLSFIEKNKTSFYDRPTALLNYDPNEIIPSANYATSTSVDNNQKADKNTPERVEPATPVVSNTKKDQPTPASKIAENATKTENIIPEKEAEKPKPINFANNIRIKHAVVIDVRNAKINVAKPFAALTKYFYTKFAPGSVNLSIRTVGDTDKLIIVKGPFSNREMAEKALAELSNSLPELLDLKASEFTSFVISDPNLLLINSTESLNKYLNFIK
ncbi:type IX secretion system periplasmic lipoprotein PorW/SprE [Pseudopedobacter saltans]|uniref:type IX secretion system periplasmic lipoprotein PorW/SprE n=1 Tax=Pseudopedobacter saltans TaxID=151895 RepID=UPI0011D184D8|nr:hypothetical protein [Pseudopedobacter saltans]